MTTLTIDDNVHQFRQKSSVRILTKADFIRGFVPPDYLVEGVLQRRYVYSLTARTGDGKTAVALHLANLIGSTWPDHLLGPHPVDKGRVLYLAGENPDDLRMRMIADDALKGRDGSNDRIIVIPGIFDIEEMYETLVLEAKKSGNIECVVVDTSAAYFLRDNENDNPQMGAHARMLRKLTTLPGGPCVIVLCHPAKHVSEQSHLMPRGGGAFLAEVDGNLTLWRNEGMIDLWWTGKLRGPGFEPITFRLEKIKTTALVDSKGRMMSTVRAVPVTNQEMDDHQQAERSDEDRLLVALQIKN